MQATFNHFGRRYGMIVALALLGGLVGFFTADLTENAQGQFRWPSADEPTLVLSFALLSMALVSIAIAQSDAFVRRSFAIARDETDLSAERRILGMQTISLLIAGAALAIPGLGSEIIGLPGEILFAAAIGLLALQTVFNRVIRRNCDEFMQALGREIGNTTFWWFQLLLFAWAAAARFGIMPEPTALHVFDLLMATYLLASIVVHLRRGVGVPND